MSWYVGCFGGRLFKMFSWSRELRQAVSLSTLPAPAANAGGAGGELIWMNTVYCTRYWQLLRSSAQGSNKSNCQIELGSPKGWTTTGQLPFQWAVQSLVALRLVQSHQTSERLTSSFWKNGAAHGGRMKSGKTIWMLQRWMNSPTGLPKITVDNHPFLI